MRNQKCINCINSNNKFNSTCDVNRTAIDLEKCEYPRRVLSNNVSNTDYPCRPVLPTSVGTLPRRISSSDDNEKEGKNKLSRKLNKNTKLKNGSPS